SYAVDVALNGRYAFPGMLPFVALLVLGLTAWRRWHGLAGAAVTLAIPVLLAGDLAYFLHILAPDVVAL
ncbi:MAG: hypothetical protein FJ029_07135, partial [Actinobacteria bacterium]|nr:hypothetical protein [Actinomycetota bacterium]